MSIQLINIGAAPNDNTGDPIRTSFDKCNDNFAFLEAGLTAAVASIPSISGLVSLDEFDGAILDLQTQVDDRSLLGHTHSISQVVGLTVSLSNKADTTTFNSTISAINTSISSLNNTVTNVSSSIPLYFYDDSGFNWTLATLLSTYPDVPIGSTLFDRINQFNYQKVDVAEWCKWTVNYGL